MKSPAIHTTALTLGYGKSVLFKDLNLALFPGELVCFMGPNGIGKSSLIRVLAGLQQATTGHVHYARKDALEHQLAVVLTDRLAAGDLTAYDILVMGRYPYLGWTVTVTDKDREIIQRVIRETKIASLLNKRIDEMSDGQLQLVMIARALAQDGDIILLDEPTAHLDLNNRLEVMNLLRAVAHVGNKAVLVATHELDLALQTADSIWLTSKENILTGMPEDLVLTGAFDEIFKFKGFDLKTGKVMHPVFRDLTVSITGSGSELLWTRNALERNGYKVDEYANVLITVGQADRLSWNLRRGSEQSTHQSVASLLQALETL